MVSKDPEEHEDLLLDWSLQQWESTITHSLSLRQSLRKAGADRIYPNDCWIGSDISWDQSCQCGMGPDFVSWLKRHINTTGYRQKSSSSWRRMWKWWRIILKHEHKGSKWTNLPPPPPPYLPIWEIIWCRIILEKVSKSYNRKEDLWDDTTDDRMDNPMKMM